MKYKLLKDLPTHKAGTIFEDGNYWTHFDGSDARISETSINGILDQAQYHKDSPKSQSGK